MTAGTGTGAGAGIVVLSDTVGLSVMTSETCSKVTTSTSITWPIPAMASRYRAIYPSTTALSGGVSKLLLKWRITRKISLAMQLTCSTRGWSRRRELNPRPVVYETTALPTELRRRITSFDIRIDVRSHVRKHEWKLVCVNVMDSKQAMTEFYWNCGYCGSNETSYGPQYVGEHAAPSYEPIQSNCEDALLRNIMES
jgi:hypothetical protein